MKIRRRRLAVSILAFLLILVPITLQGVAFSVYQSPHISQHEFSPAGAGDMEVVPSGTLEDLKEFETNLPIVVVDFYEEPKAPTVWNEEKGYREPIKGDPFVDGVFYLYYKEDGINRLWDTPILQTNTRTRLRGHSSLSFAKRQYLIKMYQEDGTKNRQDILGMGTDWEWVLNISYVDKSLLRNYMCLNLGAKIMGYAPEVRYCEVFEKDEEQYTYLGLYLLMENVKQGESRVAIPDYDSHFAEASYLLCRDRFDESRTILDTYATRQGLSQGYLSVRYPGTNEITPQTISYIEEDISRLERALYSDDLNEFLTYRDYIDVDSAVDYFILNEFFSNYDAGFNSYYLHKKIGGKLFFGPVWDYDQGIDNNRPYVLEIESTAMHDGVWFRQMLRDGEFVHQIINRYAELRQDVLSDEYIEEFIDNTLAFLGKAVVRDWNRWRYNDHQALYRDSPTGKVHASLLSNTRNFEEEIAHIKQVLKEHGSWLDNNLDSLYQFSIVEPGHRRETAADSVLTLLFGEGQAKWASGILVILLLVVFFVSITLIQRES
jgi:spore coat protein H